MLQRFPVVPLARMAALLLASLCFAQWAAAHTHEAHASVKVGAPLPLSNPADLSVLDWFQRMSAASRRLSYMGTFVVSSATGSLSSARIWHVREGGQQLERIEALSGPPRTTFRRDDLVLTFLPELHVVKRERRENLELFPNLPGASESAIADFYGVRLQGRDRVAGFDADVVRLAPRDDLRFGYRIWIERRSGLVVKLQTVDDDGRVIEQSAFSELELDAPISIRTLTQMMDNTAGYRVQRSALERTSASAEGWSLKAPVPGFKPLSCYRRVRDGVSGRTIQWTFTDGLATVSLFLEPYDAQRSSREGVMALGATYTLTRRLADPAGDWWLTAVGEVPAQTLDAFAQRLVRTR